jgi:hypothetical protein
MNEYKRYTSRMNIAGHISKYVIPRAEKRTLAKDRPSSKGAILESSHVRSRKESTHPRIHVIRIASAVSMDKLPPVRIAAILTPLC